MVGGPGGRCDLVAAMGWFLCFVLVATMLWSIFDSDDPSSSNCYILPNQAEIMKKFFILCFALNFCFAKTDAQQVLSQAFAQNQVVLNLEVHVLENSQLKLVLKPIEKGKHQLTEQVAFVIGWQEVAFTNTAQAMLKAAWPDSALLKDSVEDYKALKVQFDGAYKQLKDKYELSKFKKLTDEGYGWTENQRNVFQEYHNKLILIQDTVSLLCVARWQKRCGRLAFIQPEARIKHTYPSAENQLEFFGRLLELTSDSLKNSYKLNSANAALVKRTLHNIDRKRAYMLHLIGDANVVSSFQNATANQLNAGFGILATRPGFSEFLGIITLAQGAEDSTKDYGQSILIPGVRRFSLLTSFRKYSMFKYNRYAFLRKVGIGLDVNITPYRWVKDSMNVKVVPFAVNVMFPYTWVQRVDEGNDFAISTDVGFAFRGIGGDITNAELLQYIGTDQRLYFGPVGGLTIKYNALRAQFHAPLLNWRTGRPQVQGLTNGQVYATIGIVASLSGEIKKVIRNND